MLSDHENTLLDATIRIVTAAIDARLLNKNEIGEFVTSVHSSLLALGSTAAKPSAEPETLAGAVSIRGSVKPDRILSMIDGKPYKMLKRHLAGHGYSPESYRRAYGLPANYPMVAPDYANQRRALAVKIGLGQKRG